MPIHVAEHSPEIAIVTLDNQPRRNAVSRQDLAELGTIWERLEAAPYRCLIVTGAGDKAFCAGADVSGDLTASVEMSQKIYRGLQKYRVYRKPIVAAVNGDCVAGGVELLLSADIRAAAPHARFALTEVRWAIYPFGGAVTKLVQQIGYVHAMELLLTGRLIDAEEAARLGLVNRVVPADELMPWAIRTAEAIAANSPVAVQAVKEQITTAAYMRDMPLEPLEQTLGDRVRASADFKEGVAAFLEKRKPDY